jgi:hypothetical protein
VNQHLAFIQGVEIVYHEFKEIILELSLRLKDKIDAEPGKFRKLVKKFLDELFLKRLLPFIKINLAKKANASADVPKAERKWPES